MEAYLFLCFAVTTRSPNSNDLAAKAQRRKG